MLGKKDNYGRDAIDIIFVIKSGKGRKSFRMPEILEIELRIRKLCDTSLKLSAR